MDLAASSMTQQRPQRWADALLLLSVRHSSIHIHRLWVNLVHSLTHSLTCLTLSLVFLHIVVLTRAVIQLAAHLPSLPRTGRTKEKMGEHGTGRIRTRQGTQAQRTLSAKYCFAPMPPNLLEHVGGLPVAAMVQAQAHAWIPCWPWRLCAHGCIGWMSFFVSRPSPLFFASLWLVRSMQLVMKDLTLCLDGPRLTQSRAECPLKEKTVSGTSSRLASLLQPFHARRQLK